jgi:hypothetical protein
VDESSPRSPSFLSHPPSAIIASHLLPQELYQSLNPPSRTRETLELGKNGEKRTCLTSFGEETMPRRWLPILGSPSPSLSSFPYDSDFWSRFGDTKGYCSIKVFGIQRQDLGSGSLDEWLRMMMACRATPREAASVTFASSTASHGMRLTPGSSSSTTGSTTTSPARSDSLCPPVDSSHLPHSLPHHPSKCMLQVFLSGCCIVANIYFKCFNCFKYTL